MKNLNPLECAARDLRGKSSDEIAAMLRANDIQGRPGTTHGCPLARLMHRIYRGEFIVGRKFIYRRSNAHGRDELLKLKTPANLVRFIRQFDLSAYPDLIAPPPRVLKDKRKGDRHKDNTVNRHKHPQRRYPTKYTNHYAAEVGR